MQIRQKAYLHFVSLWRSFCNVIPPRSGDVPEGTSPFLIYTAVVLVFLLAILEVDAHRAKLESLGLSQHDYSIPAVFLGP